MTEKVRYETAGGVAVITITRPEVRNAMDLDVFDGLGEAGRRAAADPAARAVIVTGEGVFSSGIDVSVFATGGDGAAPGGIDIARLQASFTVFEEIGKPVLAAMEGYAFGAGIQLALACDLRDAGADTSMSVMETRWGIIPDLGAIHRLPRIVGLGRAKELMLTGRRIGADEALAWGLVNRTVASGEALEDATVWARELAAGPPLALGRIKRLAASAFDVPVAAGLEREAAAQRRVLASDDFREAVAARFEKRAPRYQGR